MGFEYRRNGRRVSHRAFFDGIKKDMVEKAMTTIEDKYHAIASSVVDPATGKHPEVIVRRNGKESVVLTTNGSQEFAQLLERRMGVAVETLNANRPNIYLAHASEDKRDLAEPLARQLIAQGINVWLDKWEIRYGDSLRQKMDEGLSNCSHFVVLLTPNSIGKNWVNSEIDAGFMADVEGRAKFIGIRVGLGVDELTPLLRTKMCPDLNLENEEEIQALVDQVHGVSDKPELGPPPKYIQTKKTGLEGWSKEAQAVAKFFVEKSKHGIRSDPIVEMADIVAAIDLDEDGVRVGVLDLTDAGLLKSDYGSLYPTTGMFVEFDRHFMDLDSRADALALAKYIVDSKRRDHDADELKAAFPDWSLRRFNSAINVLDETKSVETHRFMDGKFYAASLICKTDSTLRFVRRHD
ncbi:toll/interleukin-1 receptor domain-containing protein [Ponticaulis sp.]|uniref:toll/interleukin-1 receptor domain-containing protein n=1 Tax=Ponticaulis sp. TaxID=2020902 RepID=UPI000C3CB4F5|nr:toll/interleukin-1 receptor domain-containing protein [Ponticaulis sp.]MAF58808.1 molecular chaperone Tir [Ponticaulis sp.]MBN04116.1 molecular chaperone Tir [Ponticaulis sp.]MBN05742.1 molecular chaperone Tir [Ponticaulis sp.]